MFRFLWLFIFAVLFSCPTLADTKFSQFNSTAFNTATDNAVGWRSGAPNTNIYFPLASSAIVDTTNATNITAGNLSTSIFNGGSGASSSTFWRGDGTWATPAGAGTVTLVSANNIDAIINTSVANPTTTPTISYTLNAENPNIVLAGPNTGGGAATPTFRALVSKDLPNPSSAGLGGVLSLASVSHMFINGITVFGSPTASQPACSDLSNAANSCSVDATNATNITAGTLPRAQLPTPNSNALGAVDSFASTSHNWINGLTSSGVFTASQPAFTDISGTATAAQIPFPTATTIGGVQSFLSTSSAWLNGVTVNGVFTSSRPACSDLSNSGTSCTVNTGTSGATIPENNTANTFSALQTFNSSVYLSTGYAETALFSAGYCSTGCSINIDNGPMQHLVLKSSATVSLTTPTHTGRTTVLFDIGLGSSVYSISGCKWPGGSAINYSSAVGSADVVSIMYASSNYYCMGGAAFQ